MPGILLNILEYMESTPLHPSKIYLAHSVTSAKVKKPLCWYVVNSMYSAAQNLVHYIISSLKLLEEIEPLKNIISTFIIYIWSMLKFPQLSDF